MPVSKSTVTKLYSQFTSSSRFQDWPISYVMDLEILPMHSGSNPALLVPLFGFILDHRDFGEPGSQTTSHCLTLSHLSPHKLEIELNKT